MTVERLMTPFMLAQSDMQQITKDRNDLNYQMNALTMVFLPALKGIVKELREELRHADGKALATLTETPQLLMVPDLTDLVMAVVTLRQSDSNAATVDELSKEIRDQINASLLSVNEYAKALDNALSSLRLVRLVIDPQELAGREASVASDAAVLHAQQTTLKGIQDKLQLLKASIDVLEDATIIDYFKPAVTILVALADIDPRNPAVGAIRAGLKGLEGILDVASDFIRYEDLIRKREQLRKEEADQLGRMARTRTRNQQTEKQLLDLQRFVALAGPRDSYVQEVSKILLSLESFQRLNKVSADVDVAELVSRFSSNKAVLINHLNDLRRDWNTR